MAEEVKGRVARYEAHARKHAPAAAVAQFMSDADASSTMPDHAHCDRLRPIRTQYRACVRSVCSRCNEFSRRRVQRGPAD